MAPGGPSDSCAGCVNSHCKNQRAAANSGGMNATRQAFSATHLRALPVDLAGCGVTGRSLSRNAMKASSRQARVDQGQTCKHERAAPAPRCRRWIPVTPADLTQRLFRWNAAGADVWTIQHGYLGRGAPLRRERAVDFCAPQVNEPLDHEHRELRPRSCTRAALQDERRRSSACMGRT